MSESRKSLLQRLIDFILARRGACLGFLGVLTLVLGYLALQVTVQASAEKTIPLKHPYIQNYLKFRENFGGLQPIGFILLPAKGDIFNPEFMSALQKATQEVFLTPGIDRSTVRSLFSPAVRTLELIEGGFAAQNVVPANYSGTAEDLALIRKNIPLSREATLLVAKENRGAMVRASLLDYDPETGKAPDSLAVGRRLEALRRQLETPELKVLVIGAPMVIREITEAMLLVLGFFLVAFLISAFFVWVQIPSVPVASILLASSALPVLWLLGLLHAMGFGMDPLSIIVPFLIYSIGLTHAVQVGQAWMEERRRGTPALQASRTAFLATAAPGAAALSSDALGFFVLLYVRVAVVTQIGWAAGVGVALMILSHFLLLPVLLSHVQTSSFSVPAEEAQLERLWKAIASFMRPAGACAVVAVTLAIAIAAGAIGRHKEVGDLGRGAPELRAGTRYNRDSAAFEAAFPVALDSLKVYVQGSTPLDSNPEAMVRIDNFVEKMRQVPGVRNTICVTDIVKTVSTLYNEGSLKWYGIPGDPLTLGNFIGDVARDFMTPSGDSTQIVLFLDGHTGATLRRVIGEAKKAGEAYSDEQVKFLLGGGSAALMAATNETVTRAQPWVDGTIWATIILACLLTFRTVKSAIYVSAPLQLSTMLAGALMVLLGIGIKLSTLPVVSLGVGVGEDYAIYLYHAYVLGRQKGMSKVEAFLNSLRRRGRAVIATASTMGFGLLLWAFSPVKYQADLGLLLGFLFFANLVASLTLLPALVALLDRQERWTAPTVSE